MRLDKYLAEKYGSRTKSAEAILKKLVLVNGKVSEPSYNVKESDAIEFINPEEEFVSAGGYKLNKALNEFGYSPDGKVFADIGASTGGFTDCLLKHGAKKVYCIDVGESQLDKRLLCDKVVVIDNFNARYLNKNIFSEKLDGAVIDVSFISLTYIMKAVSDVLDEGAVIFALIKPQFECGKSGLGKNGIVKDKNVHKSVLEKILNFAYECGLNAENLTNAPIIEGKNLEYVVQLKKCSVPQKNTENLIKSVKL